MVGRDEMIDTASELSFPASDPPSYMGGIAVAGPPSRRAREPVQAEQAVRDEAKSEEDERTGTAPSEPPA